MISLKPETIRSILCIAAHPDDIEIGCGGTVLKLLQENSDLEVCWVVLSGTPARAAEAENSANKYLAANQNHRIEIKSFQDASFAYNDPMALKKYFQQLSTQVSPDLIFTHRREDLHQDHRFVSELTWQHFRDHLILEYEIPKYEGDLGQPSFFVPLTNAVAKMKMDLLVSEFPSQRSKPWFDEETFRALLRIRGVECVSPSGYAESFHCRKLVVG
jgi:LmbE family N-acetylglucosaminyl deacetylase